MHKGLQLGAKIGILGGGQLGRMLAHAGAELGFDMHVYDPEADCPAGRVAAQCVTASWKDLSALAKFAAGVEVVTFEFENVPAASLAHIAAITPIRPGIKSLERTQDRLIEKQLINSLGFKTAAFSQIDSLEDLHQALRDHGPDGILKTRRFGYDGKGQIRVTPQSDLPALWSDISDQAWIFEGFIGFACEVSVILARDVVGNIACYDVTENVHANGILRTSTIPSKISDALANQATACASDIAQALDHIGVLAVEFFVTYECDLIVNEVAPRVHNSGHWTQDGCNVCQFQQHIRAVAGWPLGDPKRHTQHVQMINLIGDDVLNWEKIASEPRASLHLYGKRLTRAGRKMGHVNRIGETAD